MRLLILTLTLLLASHAFAETFTVTSTADAGAGTLREAIQKAADNGNSSDDLITFDLPYAQRTDRTIIITSSLPNLSERLTIDGTSQPGGAFGVSNASVQINVTDALEGLSLFKAESCSYINVFGLSVSGVSGTAYAFYFNKVSHVVIGAPGKGNLINSFVYGIYAEDADSQSSDYVIQNNMIGTDESGTAILNRYMSNCIAMLNTTDITIGGLNAQEGNLIGTMQQSINITYSINYSEYENPGFVKINGNKIGTDISGTKKIAADLSLASVYIGGKNDGIGVPGGTTNLQLDIVNNIITNSIQLFKLSTSFNIKGNYFGLGSDGMSNLGSGYLYILSILYCNQGVIGGTGEEDKNYFANNSVAIQEIQTGNTTISQNSFRCNAGGGILLNWPFDRPKPLVNISTVSTSKIAGNSLPNSKIELFYNDDCGFSCEGKTYITTVTADASGNWSYSGSNCDNIVATSTDIYGATSEFSQALISEPNVKVTNSTCGKTNGSITGIDITSGTNWHWEDANGKTVSSDIDLRNAKAGTYVLKTSIGNNSVCSAESAAYTITDLSLPNNPSVSVTNISCGQSTGSLSTVKSNDYNVSWLANNNSVIGTDYSINNLSAAHYLLQLTLKNDATCTKTYGPYEIKSDITNSLDITNVSVTNAVCASYNGSINGIKYSEPITTNTYIEWQNENGEQWGTGSLDLSSVPPGKYQVKLKDPANCDTLFSPYYTVEDIGDIATDFSGMQILGSDECGHPYGSITGIKFTNAETFTWTSDQGVWVGNTLDISNLKPGNYKLLAGNHYDCGAATNFLTVPLISNPDFSDSSAEQRAGYCGANDGYIRPTGILNKSLYNFRWTSVSQPQITISNASNLENILDGNFYLYAKDGAGCEEKVGQYNIIASPVPSIDESNKVVMDEICGNKSGGITGITISGGATPVYKTWKDANSNIVSSNSSAENLSAGTYQLYLQDANGCTTSSPPISIANEEVNYAAPIYKDLTIPRNTVATLSVNNFQQGTYSLYNSTSTITPIQQNNTGVFTTDVIREDETLYITVSSGTCSSNTTEVHIKVADATKVSIPSAFTPNADGRNDILKPLVYGLFTLDDFSIYDRFGGMVFYTKDINQGWKGDKNGIALHAGTYIWIIKGKDIEGKPLVQKGTSVLIR